VNISDCSLKGGKIKIESMVDYRVIRKDFGTYFTYTWGIVAVVIRNVPVLPYVTTSALIFMELDIKSRGSLAFTNFTYTSTSATTLGMGATFDRDYYPEYNKGNIAKGQKITIM
jgi:hypothetical protein